MKNPVFNPILKYKNHPNIDTRENSIIFFKEVTIEEIEKDINKLSSKKGSQNSDVQTRIVKENADVFAKFCVKVLTLHSNHHCVPIF